MRLKCYPLLLLAALFGLRCQAVTDTDTIRVFQYNLLTYGDSNNPVAYKNQRLSAIISYVQPDIVGANELSDGASYSQSILTDALGSGWSKGTFSNVSHQIQTNMLFWKSDKFGLSSQRVITSIVRDIIAFKLYYKDAALATTHDTTFITLIVAHLKAGEASSDSTERASETAAVAGYLNSQPAGNYLFMGDLNLYSSNEQSYQNLTANPNATARLYDPLNRPGDWHSNSAFVDIHTQSTRTTALPDGGVTGGLDDRFDHILVSGAIMNNTSRMAYLPGSYYTVGQDGHHFNKAVNASPANTAVPANIAQALYEMSDHLPVTAAFVLTKTATPNSIALSHELEKNITVQNPVAGGAIHISFGKSLPTQPYAIALFNNEGQQLQSWSISASGAGTMQALPIAAGKISTGLYLLQITDASGSKAIKKLLIN